MTLGSAERPIEILLVEDNPGDVEITKRVLQDSQHASNVEVAEDGAVALEYLRKEQDHTSASRPDLILLDLAMPNKDGFEVLEEINEDSDLKSIPVMILTSNQAQNSRLFELGIPPSGYCPKPLDPARLDSMVLRLRTAPARSESDHTEAVLTPAEAEPVPQPAAEPAGSKKWWWPFGRN